MTDYSMYGKIPLNSTESSRGHPFPYGKKKTYTGAKDGAYFDTNVPAGDDRPTHVKIKAGKALGRKSQKRQIKPKHQGEKTQAQDSLFKHVAVQKIENPYYSYIRHDFIKRQEKFRKKKINQ